LQSLVVEMEDESPAIRLGALIALQKISGKGLGVEPGPWKKYVQERMAAEPPRASAPQLAAQPRPAPRDQVRATRMTPDDSIPPPTARTRESGTLPPAALPGPLPKESTASNAR